MSPVFECWFAAEADLTGWVSCRAAVLAQAALIFLNGDLGAGKTTVARALLRGLGYPGAVRSPTYTLMEPYRTGGREVYHFDLYRLGDPEELELIGARDCFGGDGLCLIEWPERGAGWLPTPDLELRLAAVNGGRRLEVMPHSCHGEHLVEHLRN